MVTLSRLISSWFRNPQTNVTSNQIPRFQGLDGPLGNANNPGPNGQPGAIPLGITGHTAYYHNNLYGSSFFNVIEPTKEVIDHKSLERFAKRFCPFISSIQDIVYEQHAMVYSHTTHTPTPSKLFQINVVLNPTHFAEVTTNKRIKYKTDEVLKEKLTPLIKCMYGVTMEQSIVFVFHSEKSETLIDVLNEISYN